MSLAKAWGCLFGLFNALVRAGHTKNNRKPLSAPLALGIFGAFGYCS